jgi:LAS superfamily LD-carboxypeptidase LdcB
MKTLPALNRPLIINILNVFQTHLAEFDIPALSFEELEPLLNPAEKRELLKVIHDIKPLQPGLAKHASVSSNKGLVPPDNPTAYQKRFVRIPPPVQKSFNAMSKQFMKDNGRPLLIVSGYRSEAYQALLLCAELYRNNFDLSQTLRRILPPGYSDHQDRLNPAIDLGLDSEELADEAFMSLAYPWLKTYAASYGFAETYPVNQDDMIWEPWHWRLR